MGVTPIDIDVSDVETDEETPMILSDGDSMGETCLQRIDDSYGLRRCEEGTKMKFISCESGMQRLTHRIARLILSNRKCL